MYVIFTLFIERSYISNKKARLEYYEFRIVKIEDTYIGTFSKYYKISQLIHTQNVAN